MSRPIVHPNPTEYPVTVVHVSCGGVAFFRRPGKTINAIDVMFPNGEKPKPTDRISCFACGLRAVPVQTLISRWWGRCVWCSAPAPDGRRWCRACVPS